MKRILSGLLAVLFYTAAAQAESFEGVTVASRTVALDIPSEAVVEQVLVETGDWVQEGQEMAKIKVHSVFASEDGTAGNLQYKAGEKANGTVLQVEPAQLYFLYGTVKEAYNLTENKLLHTGEILYAKCTKDGSHRGMVRVQSAEGREFEAHSLGGQLMIGETVNLYRDEAFSAASRVGTATVVATDAIAYSCEGYLCSVDVQNGESVQRGEKLFTWCESEKPTLAAKEKGVIVQSYLQNGQHCEDGIAFEIMPADALRIACWLDEETLEMLKNGGTITYTRADDAQETEYPAVLESVSAIAQDEGYRAYLLPSDLEMPVGLHVQISVQ